MEARMNDVEIRERARVQLRAGTLPRYPPMVQPGQQDVASAAMARDKPCSVCGETTPRITLWYATGAFYFHSPCYRIWDEERSRGTSKKPRAAGGHSNTAAHKTVEAGKMAVEARGQLSRVAAALGRVARFSARKISALARKRDRPSAAARAKGKAK